MRNTIIPASYAVLIRKNEVLLLQRAHTGYYDGWYSLPAGHVEAGESFTDCAVREAQEELGITLQKEDIHVTHILNRHAEQPETQERIDIFFMVDRWEGTVANTEPDKCSTLTWFPLDDLPENIIPYVREALVAIHEKRGYSERGF